METLDNNKDVKELVGIVFEMILRKQRLFLNKETQKIKLKLGIDIISAEVERFFELLNKLDVTLYDEPIIVRNIADELIKGTEVGRLLDKDTFKKFLSIDENKKKYLPGKIPESKKMQVNILDYFALGVGFIGWEGFVNGRLKIIKDSKKTLHYHKNKAPERKKALKKDKFIVGRDDELQLFSKFLKSNKRILNYFGPGGIGKTVVGHKMTQLVENNEKHFDYAFIDGNDKTLTPISILEKITQSLNISKSIPNTFSHYKDESEQYLSVQNFLNLYGDKKGLYDSFGNLNNLEEVKKSIIYQQIPRTFEIIGNKLTLMRYLKNIEKKLTNIWIENLREITEKNQQQTVLIFDTFEEIEDLSDWFNQDFYPALPEFITLCLLGRNPLKKISYDWQEFNQDIISHEIKELSMKESMFYLQMKGLSDKNMLEKIYLFTGGYPLALSLVSHLAEEVGSWENLKGLDYERDKYEIAKHLLDRLLREQKVKEVRGFLEKGVIIPYFNPEIISIVMKCNINDARMIYDKISKFSFVERHSNGMKFHDVIAEILKSRLSDDEITSMETLFSNYFSKKHGNKI